MAAFPRSSRTAIRRRLGTVFALACIAAAPTLAQAPEARADAGASALERRIKAAFLYKFAGYVEWPAHVFASAEAPLTIGVIGDDALQAELGQIVAGRTSSGRPVQVRRLEPLVEIQDVHIVFIARSEAARLRPVIRGAAGRPILIVTESPDALTHGSMINFVLDKGRVRFEVALSAVEKRGLTLSSRLLAVAQSVVTGTP